MDHLPKKIHQNGISYTLVEDYYIPDLKLLEESRPLGGGVGCTRRFCKNSAPASTTNSFCRENSGRILPI